MSKGQAVLVDFSFAFLLFILAWGFIVVQFQEKEFKSADEASLQAMRIKADFALENLVKSKGMPSNWETLTINDLNIPGLASRDRVLSEAKLSAFSNFSTSYDDLKEKLGLEEYDFYFEFEGVDSVTSGLVPGSNANEVVLQRLVEYKGGAGSVTLKVYKLE